MQEETDRSCLDAYYASLLETTDPLTNFEDASICIDEDKANANQSTAIYYDDTDTSYVEETADEILT